MYKNCNQCQKEFITKRSVQKFCSNQCQWDAKRTNGENRICFNKQCEKSFSVKVPSDKKKFCSRTCSAIVSNLENPRRPLEGSCKYCSTPISSSRTYCDEHKVLKNIDNPDNKFSGTTLLNIQKWLNGEVSGGSTRKVSDYVRKYLLKEANYTCSTIGCGFDTPHPVDGNSVLEIDHIDGDAENNVITNLRVVCPNCHALTPTYRGRNAGNGRKVFYTRTVK